MTMTSSIPLPGECDGDVMKAALNAFSALPQVCFLALMWLYFTIRSQGIDSLAAIHAMTLPWRFLLAACDVDSKFWCDVVWHSLLHALRKY